MSGPIKAGDLVQVIRPASCGCTTAMGITRTVLRLAQKVRGRCATCFDVHTNQETCAVLDGPAPWSHWHIQLSRLKRIPPMAEIGNGKNDEEISEAQMVVEMIYAIGLTEGRWAK